MIDTKKLSELLDYELTGTRYQANSKLVGAPDLWKNSWDGASVALFSNLGFFFIKRAATMPSHPNQVAFLGGHRKAGEDSPQDVALREFAEETNLPSNSIDTIGLLPASFTAKGKVIVPVLAELKVDMLDFDRQLKSNGEWDSAFWVKHSALGNEDLWSYAITSGGRFNTSILFRGLTSQDLSKAYHSSQDSFMLWGATARMVWNMLRIYNS